MTKLPHDDWNVQGVEGPKYSVGPKCAVATCERWADHAHHIWRRSFLTGDYKWVELWDGRVVQNLCALCLSHHERVTVNKARIMFNDENFFYLDEEHEMATVLAPQPKSLASFATAQQMTIDGREVPHEEVTSEREEPSCPTCGHKKARKKKDDLPPGEKRNRAQWSVSVPKDERENGADVLDELELACAEKLGRADHSSHKYYVLAEVMAAFVLGNIETADFIRGRGDEDGA